MLSLLNRENALHQIAALPFFINPNGGMDICLVTSRGGGRWIIPKGNPIRGLAPHEVAAREALEEAGLVGHVGKRCIGTFKFDRIRNGRDTTCRVDVYALKVERQMQIWTEMHERSVLRCNVKTALSLVSVPNLAALIDRYVMAHV
ncbi:MAG TPA: NUDIX hydrolase [Aestuariivirga sp.]|nr:NUDIX hydrolase [Aestuariivirga sp.]